MILSSLQAFGITQTFWNICSPSGWSILKGIQFQYLGLSINTITAISMSFSVLGLVSCLQIFLLARLCVSGCETGACHDLRVVPSLCCDMWPPRPLSRPLIGHSPAYWPLIGQHPGHCCGNMLSPRSTQIIPNGEHKLQSKRKRWGKLCFENIYFSCDHKHKLRACAVRSGLGYNEELNAALLHQ